jgi:hypothetical protein
MQWHPELKIGFSYIPNDFNGFDFGAIRGAKLQQIVVQCVSGAQIGFARPGGDNVDDCPDEPDDDDIDDDDY